MLVGLLTTLLVLVSLVLIVLIVALQHGNEGGIGSAFGGGNSAGFFGASGGVALIVRATWIFGASFFVLSTALAWVKTYDKFGVTRELESAITDTIEAPAQSPNASPAEPTEAPAAAEPAAEPAGVPQAPELQPAEQAPIVPASPATSEPETAQ